jgi:peptide/nickel transport system substrate-binding protein
MWSDGHPFGADDVVFTIDMVRRHDLPFFGSAFKARIVAAKATAPLTIKINLKTPYPRFVQEYLAADITKALVIVPKHIWEKQKDPKRFTNYDSDKGWPVSTGPYKPVKASSSEVIYQRRDDWWGAQTGFQALPHPQKIIYSPMGPTDVVASRLAHNDLDAATRLGVDVFESVRRRNPNIVGWTSKPPYAWTDPCPRALAINTQRKPWDNRNMRRALSLALDRKAIGAAAVGYEIGGAPTLFTLPDYAPLRSFMDANADLFEQYGGGRRNRQRAIELIEQQGYKRGRAGYFEKDGRQLTLTWIGPSNWVPGQMTFPLIEYYLRDVGIKAKGLLSADFGNRRAMGKFDVVGFTSCGGVTDPSAELAIYHQDLAARRGERARGNYSRWVNKRFSEISDEMAKLPKGDPQVPTLFREALTIFLKEQPVLPLHQQIRIVPFNNTYWTNWPTAENNYIHPPIWWQSSLIIIMNLKPAKTVGDQ